MKILLINKFHYLKGGAERSYLETARVLKEHGHRVAYFSMLDRHNLPTEFAKYFVKKSDYHAKINFLSKLKLAGKSIYSREAYRNLEALIADFRPDVAHLHNINRQLSPSVIYVLKKYKIPMVMTLHDYQLISPAYNLFCRGKLYERCLGGKFYRCFLDKCLHNSYSKSFVAMVEAYLYKFLNPYRHIKIFISPSLFLKRKFEQAGFTGKIIKLANPVDLKNSVPVKDKDYFLYFGRLSAEKGAETIIEAAAKAKGLKSKIVIAGAGPEMEKLKAKSRELKIAGKIKFAGYQRGLKLIKLIADARAVVVPSLCHENAPYALREAQLLTKITVCAKVGGLKEYINDGQNGFVFTPGNSEELAKILEKIDKNKKLRQQATVNIKEFIKDNEDYLSEEKYYWQLIKIYEQAKK